MNNVDEIKILVAIFQQETKSNNVLEFCVWAENRVKLAKSIMSSKTSSLGDNK